MDFPALEGVLGLSAVLIIKEVFGFLHKNRLCDEISKLTTSTNNLITQVAILVAQKR